MSTTKDGAPCPVQVSYPPVHRGASHRYTQAAKQQPRYPSQAPDDNSSPQENAQLDAQVQEFLRRGRERARAILAKRQSAGQATQAKPKKSAKEQLAALEEWVAHRNTAPRTGGGGAE